MPHCVLFPALRSLPSTARRRLQRPPSHRHSQSQCASLRLLRWLKSMTFHRPYDLPFSSSILEPPFSDTDTRLLEPIPEPRKWTCACQGTCHFWQTSRMFSAFVYAGPRGLQFKKLDEPLPDRALFALARSPAAQLVPQYAPEPFAAAGRLFSNLMHFVPDLHGR